ncbi:muconate/chloromuconate family cycloisomerase [Aliiglaciecola sp. 3_MG-2023]|uniref:muconate/chloromuconate family cycloisomerase n=1 Tax=Aliiglaciecola sp. 3_MG-2023 TaxID=3062644 RepID=UPI0026E23183|nr:muconate/chloromuconate family cycloisomerase [Aliiglaciecola sp. 3_MG-2023]MDO6693162.1 muconate/chloromuconate family cycloisomerase [Aliiglaciecola sp. 3_MG-2023]
MSKITSINTFIVDIPTIRPHKLSMTSMSVQSMVIVRISDDNGLEGIGEGTTIGGLAYGPESPESIKTNIDKYIAPLILSKPIDSINAFMQLLNQSVRGNYIAKSAIETALLDLRGKQLGVPVSELLGGACHQKLDCLWVLASGDTEKDIAEAQKMIAQRRHCHFKMKIGARAVADDVAHVKAVKQALGSDISIRVDVNQAWNEINAVKGMQALQDAGIDLVEQPTPAKDYAALVRLSEKFNIPILADESIADSQDAYLLAKQGFSGSVALKIAKAGGLKGALDVAAVCAASGIDVYGGTLLEGSIGTAAALHAWSTVPNMQFGTEMFGPLLLQDDFTKTPLKYRDFGVEIPTLPGLGLEIDEDKFTQYVRK